MNNNELKNNEYCNKKQLQPKKDMEMELRNFVCEEFCYNGGSSQTPSWDFPSKFFETENFDYIISGIKQKSKQISA
mgnify:CR=1 FL=1